jgi:hypothetical protein
MGRPRSLALAFVNKKMTKEDIYSTYSQKLEDALWNAQKLDADYIRSIFLGFGDALSDWFTDEINLPTEKET